MGDLNAFGNVGFCRFTHSKAHKYLDYLYFNKCPWCIIGSKLRPCSTKGVQYYGKVLQEDYRLFRRNLTRRRWIRSYPFIAVTFTQCRNTSPGIQSVTVSTTLTLRFFSHFLDSLGLPLTVLCQTTGKFVVLAKFCVTAIVSSRFSTTCHQPPGTNIVSPGRCSTSSWKNVHTVSVKEQESMLTSIVSRNTRFCDYIFGVCAGSVICWSHLILISENLSMCGEMW